MSKKRAVPNWKRNTLNTAVALAISGMYAAPAWSAACVGPTISTIIAGGCDATGVTPLTISVTGEVNIIWSTALLYSAALDGSLTNNGIILGGTGTNFNTARGINIGTDLSGTLTNAGTITGNANGTSWDSATGIRVWGVLSGTVDNSGTISATANAGSNAAAYGLQVNGGDLSGSLTNSGTTSVISASATGGAWVSAHGIWISGGISSTGSLTNEGTISATAISTSSQAMGYGLYLSGGIAAGGSLANSGTISSAVTGTGWAAAEGVHAWGNMDGALDNTGTISARANATGSRVSSVYGVYIGGALTGALTNTGALSTISGEATAANWASAYGVYVNSGISSTGSLTNEGTISGTAVGSSALAYGVYITGTIASGGTLTNTGDISATATAATSWAGVNAIYVTGSIAGTLDNQGTITGSAIASNSNVSSGIGLYVGGNLSGTLSNTGTLSTISGFASARSWASAAGVYLAGTISSSGSLTNEGTISAEAISSNSSASATGLHTGNIIGGSLTNDGTISASATAFNWAGAYGLYLNGSMSHVVTTDTVTGTKTTVGASLSNTGTISAEASAHGSTWNAASAYGIYMFGGGLNGGSSLTNDGTISASASAVNWAEAYGLYMGGGLNSNTVVNNTTSVNPSSTVITSIATATGASLTNTGTISGTANSTNSSASAYGLYAWGSLLGSSVTNDGTISGSATAFNWAGATGLYTGGIISGTTLATTDAFNASSYVFTKDMTLVAASLSNTGTISAEAISTNSSASAYGLYAWGSLGGSSVTNSGTISASASAVDWAEAYGLYLGGALNSVGLSSSSGTMFSMSSGFGTGGFTEVGSSLSNTGTISATAISTGSSASARGIMTNGSLNGGSSLTNDGTISASASAFNWAGAYGIHINGGLSSTANASGSINVTPGSSITTTVVTPVESSLINTGTISATAESFSTATAFGIYTNGNFVGSTLSNDGTISASATAHDRAIADGVRIWGSLNNFTYTSTPVLTSVVNMAGSSVTNNGAISVTASSSYRDARANGLTLNGIESEGSLTNAANATLSVEASANRGRAVAEGIQAGIMGAAIAGTLANAGTISATASAGSYGRSAWAAGIDIGNAAVSGTLDNSGTISASATAMNSWTSAYAAGLYIGRVTAAGAVTNSGTISATASGGYASSADGVAIGILNGTLTNSGTISAISGDSNKAFWSSAINVGLGSGSIDNQEGGVLVGNIHAGGTVSMINAGSIYLPTGSDANIGGDYTQTATGSLTLGATSGTHYASLSVGGNASGIDAVTEKVTIGHTLEAGDVLHVVTAGGGMTANSAVAVNSTNPLVVFSGQVNASGTGIDLTVAQANTMGGLYGAMGSLGSTLDAYVMGTNAQMDMLLNGLNGLSTTADMNRAMQDLQPVISGGMDQVTAGVRHSINRVIRTRQDAAKGMSSGDEFLTNSNGWVKLVSSSAKQKDKDLIAGYKSDTSGLALGVDIEKSSDARIGAAFAYTNTKVNSNVGNSDAKIDSIELVGYGTYKLAPAVNLDWQADYASNTNKGNRSIGFLGQNASLKYDSSSLHFGAGVGRNMAMGNTTVVPSLRVDYTGLSEASYVDSLGNSVSTRDTSELIIGLGADVSHPVSDTAKVVGDLGLDFNASANKDNSVHTTYTGGGATWVAEGAKPSSTTVVAGVGFVYDASDAMQITARYDLESRSKYTASTASIKLKMPF